MDGPLLYLLVSELIESLNGSLSSGESGLRILASDQSTVSDVIIVPDSISTLVYRRYHNNLRLAYTRDKW